LSVAQVIKLTEEKKAHFVTARLEVACDGLSELPLVGIGALIKDSKTYNNPRMIIVVDQAMRGEGIGKRIAIELLQLLKNGEVVEAEVQSEISGNKASQFFEALGFECVEPSYRISEIPEYKSGELIGTRPKVFKLYSKFIS
jgi:N-acetylglutamate synthase-like GNAT family acetyltransferase